MLTNVLGTRLMVSTDRVEFSLSISLSVFTLKFKVMTNIKEMGLRIWLSCANMRA